MDPTRAFQMTIDLAEAWLAHLQQFRTAVDFALQSGRPLAPEWAAILRIDLPTAAPILRDAEAAVRLDIDRVRPALAEGRLSDAIIAVKGWDVSFERLIETVVGDGPRESAALPPAWIMLKPGTDAINVALDIRYETVGQITPPRRRYQELLDGPANPWR